MEEAIEEMKEIRDIFRDNFISSNVQCKISLINEVLEFYHKNNIKIIDHFHILYLNSNKNVWNLKEKIAGKTFAIINNLKWRELEDKMIMKT